MARHGVTRNLDFIGDNPYENDADRLETVDLLASLPKPFYFNYFSLTYFPGVDLTGGAPELNPHYEYLVERLDQSGTHILTRCNLTILLEPGQEHLPEFYRDHRVELVCSLPYYQADLVDRLRGTGTFEKSLEALRRLNRLGYGEPDSGLRLNLMYNPAGAYLPPEQGALEELFRRELTNRYGIQFNQLLTLLNMPIGASGVFGAVQEL
jgi:radical SAM/Cys-rich protein